MQKIFKRKFRIWSLVGMLGSLLVFVISLWTASTSAVVIYGSNQPSYATTTPPAGYPTSAWYPVGNFFPYCCIPQVPNGVFMGTIIGPHCFITAKHCGGDAVGSKFYNVYYQG